MNKKIKLKKQKGVSLIAVFIVCSVIGILLSTTFIITCNYTGSVLTRKKELFQKVKLGANIQPKE